MAVLYGCKAYTGANPIGGLVGGADGVTTGTPKYTSPYGFSSSMADYHPESTAELTSNLVSAGDGKVIWLDPSVTYTINVMNIGTLKSGAIIASNRGTSGSPGALINWTYQNSGAMMSPIRASSGTIWSGVRIKGPRAYHSTSASPAGKNIAIMSTVGAVQIEIENCELYDTSMVGFYAYGSGDHTWMGSNMHWVHHCYIHGHQRWGFGYGTCQEHGSFILIECNLFLHNRHHVMGQAAASVGAINDYNVRYNYFGLSDYGNDGPTEVNHQVDMHGGSTYAGDHSEVHHNTFAANDGKVNVGLRGKAKTQYLVYSNWTRKTYRNSPPAYNETAASAAFGPLASGGSYTSDTPASRNEVVTDNWYGSNPPSGTSVAAELDTLAATSVATGSATLNGQVISLGEDSSLTVSFEYGTTTSYGSSASVGASGLGTFAKAISSLAAGTTYHFRAKGVGSKSGTVYGPDRTFTTPSSASAPAIVTGNAQNVTDTEAEVTCMLSSLGTAADVNVYWQWGLTTSYGTTSQLHTMTAPGSLNIQITGLTPGATYHFRAVAVGDGTTYGEDKTFTTVAVDEEVPWCVTMPATSVTYNGATLHAAVSGLTASHAVTKRGFRWGTESGVYTGEWSQSGNWTADMAFSTAISGLEPETTYYYMGFIEFEE